MKIRIPNIIAPELDKLEMDEKNEKTRFYICDFCGWVLYIPKWDSLSCPNCELKKFHRIYPDTAFQMLQLNKDQNPAKDDPIRIEFRRRIEANRHQYKGKEVTLRQLLAEV